MIAQTRTTERGGETSRIRVDRCLLARYVDVLNRSILEMRRRFPFHVVFDTLRRELADRPVRVCIADSSRSRSSAITLRFDGGRLVEVPSEKSPELRWQVRREHVNDVIVRPWCYLADPMRFELPPFSVCGK